MQLKAQTYLKCLFISYLRIFHWPEQVTFKAEVKGREVHSALHEVMVRMWIYASTIGAYRSETNNLTQPRAHTVEWHSSPLCLEYSTTSTN